MAGKQTDHQGTCCQHSSVWCLLHQHVQIGVEITVCDSNSSDRDDLPVLQQLPRLDRSSVVLSADSIFPDRDAHCTGQGTQVLHQMGMAQDTQLGLLGCVARRGCWFRTGARA